jgi:hypothetical protein
VLGEGAKAFGTIVKEAEATLGMSRRAVARYWERPVAGGVIRQSAGLYWANRTPAKPGSATVPHPFKDNDIKAETARGEGTTLLGVGWSFHHCHWTDRKEREVWGWCLNDHRGRRARPMRPSAPT